MKKNKKLTVVAGFAVLGLSCAVVGAAMATPVKAFAADAFAANTEGGAVYPGAKSEKEVLDALNKKVEDLNAAIKTANDAGKDLAEAYADGEIFVYSTITGSNGYITAENKRSGWKVWDSIAMLDLKTLNVGAWGEKCAFLTYNGVDGNAYIVAGKFAENYSGDGKKLASAMGDSFRVDAAGGGYITYQNFAGGYMKLENDNVSVVPGKNVDATGAESAVDPTDSGYVGAANGSIAAAAGTTVQDLYNAFVSAYDEYTEGGFNVGYPFSAVDAKEGLFLQSFRNGDSVSNPWNDGNRTKFSFLSYNANHSRAYLLKDEFARVTETNGDAKKLGYPTGDQFEAGGNRYQNFENGYMKAEGTTPQNTNATLVSGKTMGANGEEAVIKVEDNIGAFGPTVKDNLIPSGYTRETFSAAIKEAYGEKVNYYEGETLVSVERVAYTNGYLSQAYTDNGGKRHMLVYNDANDEFLYLRPAVVEKLMGSLGKPTAERIRVAQTESESVYAYPFANGYIKLTVSEQEIIEDGEAVTVVNEYAVATEGATYDADAKFFATESFSDRITTEIVSHKTSGNDASVDDAYWSTWQKEQPSDAELVAAFKKAYDDAFAIGFSAGMPSPGGILFWKSGNSGVIKLTLKGGNGNANFWGDNTIMLYNPMDGKVYISTGDIANAYANDGASGNGWATTQMKINTATGVIVQQFDITDIVVSSRPVYMIKTPSSTAQKVEGTYDFEANAEGGEWVDYLSQFGGSISAKPVTLEKYQKGANVSVDFKQYLNNDGGYTLGWKLVSQKGALSNDGVYTLENIQGDEEVCLEVWSAFDKLTFNVTLSVEGGQTVTPGPEEDPGKKGCGSEIGAYGALAACLTLAAAGTAVVVLRKRKEK